ncbi:MAG: hypothetical protein Q8L29_02470 [archaeon]|nr:hypothetical protein [archaeon]
MGWILIAGLFLVLIVFLLKFKEVKHRFFSFITIILILFVILSASFVFSNNDLDLTSFDGFVKSSQVYLGWLGGAFSSFGDVTAYVIRDKNWGAGNSSIS